MLIRNNWIAWLLLGLGLSLSVLAAVLVAADIDEDDERRFDAIADQLAIKLSERLASCELILSSGAALFSVNGEVSAQSWRSFVEKSRSLDIVPGIQGIGFSRLIRPEELERHVAQVRDKGFTDYEVRPPGRRDLYSAITYLEPLNNRNLRAIGYDMYSEPVRRQAMQQAADTGLPSLSGKVKLVQEGEGPEQAGTLMYVPVYRKGIPQGTVEERRSALLGWVYSPYRMGDFLSAVLADWEATALGEVALDIYDGAEAREDALLFSSQSDRDATGYGATRQQRRLVEFSGRQWLLTVNELPQTLQSKHWRVWVTFLAGAVISLLLFAFAQFLVHARDLASRMAEQLTRSLRESEQKLFESEFRWHFAVDGAGDGLWDWDISLGRVFFSEQWKAMLGFSGDEIGDGLDEWEKRIHPDDLASTLDAVSAYLEGRAPKYGSEHRVLCKDGSYKWVLDRGAVVSRDAAGKPLRMIGTHKDISQTKQLEESLRRNHDDLQEAQRIAQLGTWKLDLASGQIEWSEQIRRTHGLAADQAAPHYSDLAKQFTAESWARFEPALQRAREQGEGFELELQSLLANGSTIWELIRGKAVRDPEGRIVALHGVSLHITHHKQAQLRIEQLTRLYAVLSECNAAIVQCHTQAELFARICEVVVRSGAMKMAWLGVLDPATQRILPAYSFGEGLEYLDGIEVSADAADEHGQGPTGTAVRENRPVWLEDFAQQAMPFWRKKAIPYGWAASAAIPLCRGYQPFAVLSFYSSDRVSFDGETRTLLAEIGASISYAIDHIEVSARAEEYQATLLESEQRYRILVEQSIAGVLMLEDGKVVYANSRAQEILVGGQQALDGQPLQELLVQADRQPFNLQLQRLLDEQMTSAKFLFSVSREDGSQMQVGMNSALARYQGRPVVIGLMQDISERKVAEDQIRRYAQQLEHTFIQTIALANKLSEIRDPSTVGHEQQVAALAIEIGRRMGLSADRLEGLRVGGYLHDVGKIAIPAEILAKPTRLSELEYALIKEHAERGYEILKEVDFPWPVADIAHQHHERFDGSGYPRGLKGEAILLEARIIAVADVVESMASHRPYRPSLGIEKALQEIERGAGTSYDPQVATICLRLFREDGYVIPSH